MPPPTDSSVIHVLETLRAQYPGTPFLALGQTVLWDEPTKAIWRRLLDEHWPGARLIAGVHDTDYFAKTSAHVRDDQKYVALPHDDGRTRDLWSAAGELSSLFGSESVPTRQMYRHHGVPFDWLAQTYPGGKGALYADKTAAWGWRGIVHTESHSVIAHDIPIKDIQDALLQELDWGFAQSIACLDDAETQAGARQAAAAIRDWVTDFLTDCSENCRLSDLYQTLLPRFYELLLGAPPADFETTTSTALFRFHSETCRRPLFELLRFFLDPQTRAAACEAYNRAVGGSGIYTLDAFGEGAIPFDLVIPGRGRGTIRLTEGGVVIETAAQATDLRGSASVETVEALADLIGTQYGRDAALVGKAVTLADMIAAEHLVLFHETASAYTGLTQSFNARLAEAGMSLTLYPIVRLTYPTWDALAAVPESTTLRLPAHLAETFREEAVAAPTFARRWRTVVETQRQVLRESSSLRKARDLMNYLDDKDGQCWCNRLGEYEEALSVLKNIAVKSDILRDRQQEHQSQKRMWQRERQALEQRSGEDWRHNIQPLREKIAQGLARGEDSSALNHDLERQMAVRATAFEGPLAECRELIRATDRLIMEFRKQRRLLERGPEARQARATITAIIRDARMAHLNLIRNAFLTVEGLEHTQVRPTAWWLPLVDSSGGWFDAMVAGTKARLEPLIPD